MARRKENTIVGLEIEAGSVAAAEVSTNGGPSLLATAIAPLAPELFHDGEVADADVIVHFLSRAGSELQPTLTSLAIGHDGMIEAWPAGFFDEFDHALDELLG